MNQDIGKMVAEWMQTIKHAVNAMTDCLERPVIIIPGALGVIGQEVMLEIRPAPAFQIAVLFNDDVIVPEEAHFKRRAVSGERQNEDDEPVLPGRRGG